MDIKNYLQNNRYVVVYKIIGVLSLIFLHSLLISNFSECVDIRQVQCPDGSNHTSGEICKSNQASECCQYIYPEHPQCYHYSIEKSLFAGIAGSALMVFAELFFFIAFAIYSIFPWLARIIVFENSFESKPTQAAIMSTEIFSKAIYLITPILIIIILIQTYLNLPM